MCYMNCIHENYQGECAKRGGFPPGWICPHDREECVSCHGIFDQADMEDGLCNECQAEKTKVKRYAFVSIPGGVREHESETGEWVKYSDVQELIEWAETHAHKQAV